MLVSQPDLLNEMSAMSIAGLGQDIVEIARIEASLGRLGERFATRILAAEELALWQQHQQPARFLAKRFAAKEAAAKALGTGIGRGVSFTDICIENDKWGKPLLRLSGGAAQRARDLGVKHQHLTITDERHYAAACVILER